ncbi:MAG TPA: glycosyltransferase family 2 protein [Pirellulales bacterium]|jgi:dolichol-phosphate mannosyltransferase|nr:glycosyltransferase family 2 protein [Pirellulales bacterium]
MPALSNHDLSPDLPACDLSVVVPVFNEEESLRPLDAEIRAALRSTGRSAEIIYIDDCSRDSSLAVLEELCRAADETRIRTRIVRFRRNYGQTAAMDAGFELAEGAVVFPLDADGQNNPADIPRLLAEYEKGYDVVSGWRKHRQDKAVSRKLPSWVANRMIGRVSGVRLHDYGCTLKAYRGSLLKELHLYGEMHRFIPLYLAILGAKVTELPVDHRPRLKGVSKYGSRRIFKVFLDLLLIRFMTRYYNRPMHFFGQVAIGFMALLSVSVCLMVIFKFGWLRLIGIDYQSSFVQTPLPEMASTFLIGAIISLFFGILGEVLVRVHYESRGTKPYKVEGILDSFDDRRIPATRQSQGSVCVE